MSSQYALCTLHSINRLPCCVGVVVIEGCKLLHLFGYPAETSLEAAALLFTYTFPFSFHLPAMLQVTAEATSYLQAEQPHNQVATVGDYIALLPFLLIAGLASLWASGHLVPALLTELLHKQTTSFQVLCATLSAYLLLWSAVSLVFWKGSGGLRRYLHYLCFCCTYP